MNCIVCKSQRSKYKCPTCSMPYCTLKCWNVHCDQKCEKSQQEEMRLESTLEHYQFKTEDTVPFETLKLLEQSEDVRATLYNPHVRSILNVIDKSQDPSSALKVAMLEPIFVQFVEECLKIVEPVPDVSGYEF